MNSKTAPTRSDPGHIERLLIQEPFSVRFLTVLELMAFLPYLCLVVLKSISLPHVFERHADESIYATQELSISL